MKTVELDKEHRTEFESRFVGLSAGAARVVAARLEDRVEAEGVRGLLSLELAPPPAGAETWSTDDMFELRQAVRRQLAESGVEDVVMSFVGGAGPDEMDDPPAPGGKEDSTQRTAPRA